MRHPHSRGLPKRTLAGAVVATLTVASMFAVLALGEQPRPRDRIEEAARRIAENEARGLPADLLPGELEAVREMIREIVASQEQDAAQPSSGDIVVSPGLKWAIGIMLTLIGVLCIPWARAYAVAMQGVRVEVALLRSDVGRLTTALEKRQQVDEQILERQNEQGLAIATLTQRMDAFERGKA